MTPYEISVTRRLCSFRPSSCSTLLVALLLLSACAGSERSALSPRQTSTSDPAGAGAIDPAIRERIFHAIGQADEQTLRDALSQQPGNVDAAILLARALLGRRSPDQALEVLDAVLQVAPGELRALNAKAVVLDHEDRHREAQALYRQALETAPENAMLHNNLTLSLALESKAESGNTNQRPLTDGRQALARSK